MVIISDIQLPKNADGILKVSDVSTSAGGDLSARQTITDPTTSTFVKTDAVGRLNVLESSVEGAGADNSLNATEYAVKQMGAFDGSAYRVAKCSNVGRLEVDINSGGSTGGATETTLSALNDKITKGNATITAGGSLQSVLMYGRKTDGTLEPLECNGDRLLVDVVELATSGPISTSTALSSVQICGINTGDGRFKTLKCNADGELAVNPSISEKEQVDIFTVGTSVGAGATETSNSLELKGSGKAHIFIKTGSVNQSGTFQISGDGVNFYLPTTGGFLTSVGAPTSDILEAEVDTGARYIKVFYNNTGGGGANVITSSKLTYS